MVNNFELRIETNSGAIDINQGAPETIHDKLNRLAKECGFDNISTDAIHIIRDIDQPTGITHLFNRTQDEAFVLSNPVSARIAQYRNNGRTTIPEDYTGGVAVKRICVGFPVTIWMQCGDFISQRNKTEFINEIFYRFIN